VTGSGERVLFVHAHPDDETISTGLAIATLIDRGAGVVVVTCTRGERGEVIPANLQHLARSPDALGTYREGELAAALAALGVDDHRMLGNSNARSPGRAPRRYLDSGMLWGANGATARAQLDADSLSAADLAEVTADIAAVIVDIDPDVVVSYDSRGGYGHPDHVRAHDATRAAASALGVPFYVIDALPKTTHQIVVAAAPVAARKRAALEQHRTQVTVAGDEFALSSGVPRSILEPERFSRLAAPAESFAEHGIASRIAACLLAVALGALTGATLTVTHQQGVLVGATRVPWGIIAALVISAALFVGLRIVFNARLVVACAAAGLVGATAWLALATAGGSEVVEANAAGLAWAIAPAVLAGVVIAWPTSRRLR
jgi:N-acetyl-1-D-myo-inositol-2-amino-2-deoxy-alpha-D-glucopyranoside deacetylase